MVPRMVPVAPFTIVASAGLTGQVAEPVRIATSAAISPLLWISTVSTPSEAIRMPTEGEPAIETA